MNGISVRLALRAMAWGLLLAAASCAPAGERGGPVTTKTEAGTTTAAPASEVAARKNALVRFVHAVPGLASVDLFAGDSKAFEGAAYKTTSAYRELPSAKADFRLRLSGQDTAEPLAQESESFATGRHQTLVALPARGSFLSKEGGAELRLVADEFETPAAGKAKVRVFNASPDIDELDLYATGRAEPVVKAAKFGSATAYADAEPTGAGLELRRAGENITTLAVPNVRLEAGRLYTIFVVGGTKGAARLETFVIEDQLGAATSR